MAKDLTVRIVEDISLWDSFVSFSPQGTVFSTSAWLAAGAAAQGAKPVILGVWEGDTLIAGLSFAEIIRGLLKKAATPVLTPYGGFIYQGYSQKEGSDNESLNVECAEKMIAWLQQKYNHIILAHAPGLTDIRPFSWQNWSEKVRYTYILDITDTDKLWGQLRQRARRKIRKAEDSLMIGGSIDAEHIGDICERIFRGRNRFSPVPRKMVASIVSNLMESGLIEIKTAQESNGEVIAVQVIVFDKHTVYTWVYGTIPEKSHTGADSLLLWDAVKRHSGIQKKLDMVGANIPSIAFFKKAFGGMLTPYYVTERYSSLMSRTAFHAYSSVKRLLRW